MVIPQEIRKNVIDGLILDENGCWCSIDEVLSQEREQEPAQSQDTISPKEELPTKIIDDEKQKVEDQEKSTDKTTTKESPKGKPLDEKDKQTHQLDTKRIKVAESRPDPQETKLMRIDKIDFEEYEADAKKKGLDETSELDNVFSEIMSELEVFSEEGQDDNQNPSPEEERDPQESESDEEESEEQAYEDASDENEQPESTEIESSEEQEPENVKPEKVLSDWDNARSKTGKLVLYFIGGGALLALVIAAFMFLF